MVKVKQAEHHFNLPPDEVGGGYWRRLYCPAAIRPSGPPDLWNP